MCEIITIDGSIPNSHDEAVKLLGDPIIEVPLDHGVLPKKYDNMIDRLLTAGHHFKVVTFDGLNKAYLVATL